MSALTKGFAPVGNDGAVFGNESGKALKGIDDVIDVFKIIQMVGVNV